MDTPKLNNSYLESPRYLLYRDIITLLSDIKLTRGPLAVTSTLNRHKKIVTFLDDFQKRLFVDLNNAIDSI
jgi:hypothetical protein